MLRSFDQLQHLLPRGRAWSLIADKLLRRFFRALSTLNSDSVAYNDLSYLDLFPPFTRRLDQWEQQFNLLDTGLTDEHRRSRLLGAWRASGGQSPGYIQDTLRAAGFSVYVHDWFDSAGTARNPALFARDDGDEIVYTGELGDTDAELGETDIELGETADVRGSLLVNVILDNAGSRVQYSISSTPATWTHYIYIGGKTFPELATIDPKRRDEFEELVVSLKPAQTWVGVLAEYGAESTSSIPSDQVF